MSRTLVFSILFIAVSVLIFLNTPAEQTSAAGIRLSSYVRPTAPPVPTLSSRTSLIVTKTPTPTPTLTKTPTPTPTTVQATPTPTTIQATPTPTPIIPTQTPTPIVQVQAPSSNVQTFIMNAINDYRASQGLSKVTTDSNTCSFAAKRAAEITTNFSHDGFKNFPYPSYTKVTENLAMNSDYTRVVNAWINSPGHAENMRADTPYVCVEQNGNYYAYEGWKP